MQQIELDIASALAQLVMPIFETPTLVHARTNDLCISGVKLSAHILGKGKVGIPVIGVQIVIEDATNAARLVAMDSNRGGAHHRRPALIREKHRQLAGPAASGSDHHRRQTTPARLQ